MKPKEHYPAEDQVGGAGEEASCNSRKPDGIKSGGVGRGRKLGDGCHGLSFHFAVVPS